MVDLIALLALIGSQKPFALTAISNGEWTKLTEGTILPTDVINANDHPPSRVSWKFHGSSSTTKLREYISGGYTVRRLKQDAPTNLFDALVSAETVQSFDDFVNEMVATPNSSTVGNAFGNMYNRIDREKAERLGGPVAEMHRAMQAFATAWQACVAAKPPPSKFATTALGLVK